MYNSHMKSLIKYVMELEIDNFCTLNGYKGGDILKVSSQSDKTIELVKSYCHKLEINTNVIKDKTESKLKHIFCEFGEDIEIYKLIDDDEIYELLS